MTADLLAAAATYLARSRGSRRDGAAALSATYRRGGASDAIDLAAYLTVRLPATLAAVSRVLDEVAARRPGFAPTSLLDAGAGPGTASWAAQERWPTLSSITLLDRNPAFLDLARDLAQAAPFAAFAQFRSGDLSSSLPRCDLVAATYALAEVPPAQLAAAVAALWQAAAGMLVLVEPGTPDGFARLRAARSLIAAQGGVPVAPCPAAGDCPMTGADWCHFAVRLARSRAHMHAKGAQVPFEDEKFAYLAMSREGPMSGGARVLDQPRHSKAEIALRLCRDGAIATLAIRRRDKLAYRQLRKARWGDLLR